MAVDTSFISLLQNLKLEDPWLPPKPWESIPSESGVSQSQASCSNFSSPPQGLHDTSTLSEASMVRLVMNALQGVQSALVSIEKISAAFCSDPADRTFNRIPNLWTRSTSTHALGKILISIGCSGSLVLLLHKFVDYFTNGNLDRMGNVQLYAESSEHKYNCDNEVREYPPYSLVNQAFSIAVGKVLEGYICGLDTLYTSAGLRRSLKGTDVSSHTTSGAGCLTSIVHSDVTLLEVYLHTKELRTHIHALGNICNLSNVPLWYSESSLEDITVKASLEFMNFPRGGALLTYLYTQLQVADPVHRALLKFLFLRSCEPYCRFIRSWIYEAKISDPYKEFIVECVEDPPPYSHGKAGISVNFPLATIRERDGVAAPCFLKNFSIPLFRAGQQLQVLMKLFELCYSAGGNSTHVDMLPCWRDFSNNHPSYESPLTFNKRNIEALVIERSSFYKKMQEKLENLFINSEVRHQQVVPNGSMPVFVGSLNIPVSFTSDEGLVCSSANKRGSDMAIDTPDPEASSTTGEFYCMVDPLESSECSSLYNSEEDDDCDQRIELPNSLAGLEQTYLSALCFSSSIPMGNPSQKPSQSEKSHSVEISHETCGGTDFLGHFVHPNDEGTHLHHISMPLQSREPNRSWMPESQCVVNHPDMGLTFGGLLENSFHADRKHRADLGLHLPECGLKLENGNIKVIKEGISYFRKMVATTDSLTDAVIEKDQLENGPSDSSNAFTVQSWMLKYCRNFFSMNPMLRKSAFFHLTSKPGEVLSTDHRELFSCFDFSSVEDPLEVCLEKLAASSRHELGAELSLLTNPDSSTDVMTNSYDRDIASIDKTKLSYASALDSKHHKEDAISADVSGGSGWESLLASSGATVNNIVGNHKQSMAAMFDIPLDFIIDKCLLQEIMLQYKYVSKLTIKLLEEGFALQEHLLALRRYHFMEVADWADLFIRSLWHHKWYVTEADKRISEIQGLLELSVQRSSCEKDHNKGRLFVYMRGQGMVPFSVSSIGVRSFDFLGLGYRVDWPVSIVLTPSALKIYAEIFNFLIHVKLALYALTDVWCSLKDLMHVISQNRHSELHGREVHHFNILMKMRHQVNHFVSTLQQYVLSQLSHISWSRFIHSLKHKVKDMMDFESVHMAYLTDSLQICFLSNETHSIASIIQSILQCALDFRSCLVGGTWDGSGDLLSQINISKVLAIKETFDKKLKELHLCYLKSPKHAEFGLSRFWGYINYNDHYSDAVGNEMGFYAFPV